MADRSFKIGRQSEQMYNEDLYKVFESIQTLLKGQAYDKDGPEANVHGSLWLKQEENALYSYDKNNEKWNMVYMDQFRQISEIMAEVRPENPVYGQLWINRGLLWCFNGEGWEEIRAYDPEDDVRSIPHDDFLLLHPLNKNGGAVENEAGETVYQYLVPDADKGRMHRGRKLATDFIKESKVAVQYPAAAIDEDEASWIHVNPSKLTKMTKHVLRIDPHTAYYEVSMHNTELFGFTSGSPYGTPLCPSTDTKEGDYRSSRRGVVLTEDTMQKYDFLLVVRYDFSGGREIGKVHVGELAKESIGYYLDARSGYVNMFVQGYDLEDESFDFDPYTKTVQTEDEEISIEHNTKYEISFLKSKLNEYGYIRQSTTDGTAGIIRPRHHFINPLIIVSGQAIEVKDCIKDEESGSFIVRHAKPGMSYALIELRRKGCDISKTGVTTKDGAGRGVIEVTDEPLADFVGKTEGLVLFIDGVLMKKEDIVRDYQKNIVYVEGLSDGQEYILIQDKYNDLYAEDMVHPAYATPIIDESLVFMNGHLLNNATSVKSFAGPEETKARYHNEVRVFETMNNEGQFRHQYKVWNEYLRQWLDCSEEEIEGIDSFCFGYDNGIKSIALRVDHTDEDKIDYWIYKFANSVESPVRIYKKHIDEQTAEKMWAEAEDDEYGNKMMKIETAERFPYGANALRVYLNGVRLYDRKDFHYEDMQKEYADFGVTECAAGDGFYLKAPFVGNIYYILEYPEERREKTCEREILTFENRTDMAGVYRTNINLLPGITTLYIGGLRQSRDSFVIMDSNTILIKDQFVGTGHGKNHLRDEIPVGNDFEPVTWSQEDLLLVEVRQDYRYTEKAITKKTKAGEASLAIGNPTEFYCEADDIPRTILNTNDEILIYINGLFTGYRNDEGYRKNMITKSVALLACDYSDKIYHDGLYNFLLTNPALMRKWEEKNGPADNREVTNKFLLEWR